MIDIKNKIDCCGCNACGDICPTQAIDFQTDNEGFWYPKVNLDKCINCGLCEKTCPIINVKELKKNDFDKPECYAAENKNLEVVFDSTSGGLFSAFADKMYREKGFVGGAVFSDDCKTVKQYISPDKNDLPRLRSSKYLQSDLTGFFKQVRELLKNNEKVLVCGCPCQMAALRAFLMKPYENLIILDFVCLGINSPMIWQKYLDTFEERYGSKVVYAKPKSKELGWRNLTNKIRLANGDVKFETVRECAYTRGYIGTHAFIRPSCYECKFRGIPRISDITLADFWGIENYNKEFEKDLGTSLVMVNSRKGKEWFDKIKDRLNFIPMPFEAACAGNPALTKDTTLPEIDREQFFKDVRELKFGEVAEKYNFFRKPSSKKLLKRRIYRLLQTFKKTAVGMIHLNSSIRTLRHNSLKSILSNRYISFAPHAYCQISGKSDICMKGMLKIGYARFKHSHFPTQLLVDSGSKLTVLNDFVVGYGSDIQVLSGGELILKGKGGSNVNFNLICSNRIEIGEGVRIGRNVTIRDNNGNHYINRSGYKNSRPVIIGDRAWLCEGCTIMPGVKIGAGAIIGAKAFVTSNVPPNAMVAGNPARIVDEDVLWKY